MVRDGSVSRLGDENCFSRVPLASSLGCVPIAAGFDRIVYRRLLLSPDFAFHGRCRREQPNLPSPLCFCFGFTQVRSERVKRQRQSEAALRNLGKSVAILSPPAKKTTQGAARVGGSDRGSGVRLSVSANRSLGEKKQHPEASESRTIRLSLNTNGSPSPHGGISGHNSGSSNSIARGSSHSGSGASRTSMAESGGLTRPTTIHLGLGNRNADNNGAIGQPGGNARLGGGGGGQEFRKSGFRTIVPGALGTNAWPKGAAADGKASPSSESGGKARSGRSGAFGKLSDASREDRILEVSLRKYTN